MDPLDIECWIASVDFETKKENYSTKRPLEEDSMSCLNIKRQRRASDLPEDSMQSDPTSTIFASDSASNAHQNPQTELTSNPPEFAVTSAVTSKTQYVALEDFEKPVHFTNESVTLENIPEDVKQLWIDILQIRISHEKIFPSAAKDQVQLALPVPDTCFQLPGIKTAMEWEEANGLLKMAAGMKGAQESEWNFDVHHHILRATVNSVTDLRTAILTTATIHDANLPKVARHATVEPRKISKLVDFGISLLPDEDLLGRLVAVLSKRLGEDATINPVRLFRSNYHPIAIAIETKSGIQRIDACQYQLGVWVSSWHTRMTRLKEAIHIPTVPVISVIGHDWDLYLAENKGNQIDVHGPIRLGTTAGIEELFVLLACLQRLCSWVLTDFKKWITDLVLSL